MNRLCDTCKSELQPGHAFCDQCGAAVLPVAATTDAPAAAPTAPVATAAAPAIAPPPAAPSAPSGGGAKTVVIALVVVLALTGAAAGGWMYVHRGASVTAPASAAVSGAALPATTAPLATATTGGTPDAASATRTSLADPAAAAASPLDAASEAAAQTKPCSLLSRADLEPILGAKIVKITSTDQGCSYSTDETKSVDIDSTWTGGKASYAEMHGFNSQVSTPVPGIGDDAYFQAAGVLHLLKGDRYIVVNSRAYPDELKTESAIAAKILEKLK